MLNFQGAHLPKTDKRNNKTAIEPTVVDEAMIIKAVKDYNQENKITASDVVTLQNLALLSLSFKNIWKIENFQGLERLEKLQLDNNIIQRIENLDHLVHLKWLDLSFNLISEIEGLDKLVELTDLSLFNNQLKAMGGLDQCKKLNVLSIGNNKIPTFEVVTSYFSKDKGMKFKHLQVLNVIGNPFTKDSEYKNHIINSLPNLRYLDYCFIDEQERNRIRESDEKFRTDAMTQDDFLKQMQNQEEEEKRNGEALHKKQNARMDLVERLSDELIQDEELDKVKSMKGVEEEIAKFQEKIKETVENLQKNVQSKNLTKLQSIDKFEVASRHRIAQSERETIETIKRFEHSKKLAFRAKEQQNPRWRDLLDDLYAKTIELKDDLLKIELALMVEMETAINDFDSKLSFIAKEMTDYVGGDHGFKRILEAIKEFGQKLMDIAKVEQERYQAAVAAAANSNGKQEEINLEWDEELQGLFDNKDTTLGTMGNIKETLSQKAVTKEGNIITLIERDVKTMTTNYKEKQYERNRKNIYQINNQIEEYQKQIRELQVQSDEDSDG